MPLFEKIAYYKTILTKEHATYVDKIQAKEIVPRMTDSKAACAKIIRILSGPDDFHESDLNTDHIVKSAHGSAWNVSIEPTTTVNDVRHKLHMWNKPFEGDKEPHYAFIQPRFFIEEKVVDAVLGRTGNAIVYLIRCIHGKPFVIGVSTKKGQNSYDLNWQPVKNIVDPSIEKPKQLDEMLEYAKVLSAPFEFVRIDFYIGADEKIYFSEFTFTPSAGTQFYSMSYEKLFGKLWK